MKSSETGIVRLAEQRIPMDFSPLLNLQPGHYDLEASQTGFTTFRQTGILLDVDSAECLNIKLNVGQVSEKVEVSGEGVQLDTASTQMGQVISERTITAVPLVTRSYTDLLALQPGVTPTSSGLAGGQGGQFSATGFTFTHVSGDLNAGNLSVNGQRESSNGFLLNGTTVQEFAFSGAAIIPNLDSIAEFRIVTNNFDAEYGNYAGGQINVITKSGANRFHGSVFRISAQLPRLMAPIIFPPRRTTTSRTSLAGRSAARSSRIRLFFLATIRAIVWSSGRAADFGFIQCRRRRNATATSPR